MTTTIDSAPWAPGRLPGIGHAHLLLDDPIPLIRRLPDVGPVVRVGLGPRPVYLVTTAELLRSIGLGTAGRFHRDDLIEPVAPFAGRTLVTLSGDDHRRRRRLIAPAFHRNRISAYSPEFGRIAEDWVARLPVGEPIDLVPEVDRLALETLIATLIAADLGEQARSTIQSDSPLLLAEAAFRTLMPRPLRRLRPAAERRFLTASARLRGLLRDIVAQYRTSGTDHGDLLSTLVTGVDPGTGESLDDETIIDEMVGFLMGGVESPSGMLVSFVHELVRAPEVRDKAVAEVDEVIGDRPVRAEDATALPYLRTVLQETMRLWAPWINMLTADGPVTLGDVTVPSGTMVGFSANMIHHDPSYYPEPERFRPERWSDPEAELVDQSAVVPFGVGARRCPGDHFSWAQLTLQAAALLRTRLPVLPTQDVGRAVGSTTKGVGIRPSTARVVLYPRR
ncbi:cytochrome P450 [Dietzia aerolata]|uniref:Cytochrome P450 n=1 Tax=Dietzia aerolata TaxID=595984 RepID=A0ABV5JLN1_9ACTN|nr:cytochrome P450 [Dietzia aerolata]